METPYGRRRGCAFDARGAVPHVVPFKQWQEILVASLDSSLLCTGSIPPFFLLDDAHTVLQLLLGRSPPCG